MNKGEQVVGGFWEALNKMIWLNNQKMKEALNGYKPSEIHCIEYIGGNADSNVTKLADAFRMTTGGVTKITKKLIEKDLLESYQKPENKKEIYFSLTKQGQAIFDIHKELHTEFSARDKAVFAQTSDEEFDGMLRFVKQYSSHLDAEIKKLGAAIQSEPCDRF